MNVYLLRIDDNVTGRQVARVFKTEAAAREALRQEAMETILEDTSRDSKPPEDDVRKALFNMLGTGKNAYQLGLDAMEQEEFYTWLDELEVEG